MQPVGSIRDATGKVALISPMRIHNPLNPNETPTELYIRLLLSPEDLEWTFSQGSDGSLTIWPRLKAAGWQDAIPVSQDKFNRVNRLLGYVALDKCAQKMCMQIYGQMEQEAA